MSDAGKIETITGYTTFTHEGTNMTVSNSSVFKIWMDDENGRFSSEEKYSGGTKLLRDAAQRADNYCRKKARTRSGWKTWRELRDV